MFGWEFPPFNSGGLGVACYGLAKSLSRAGVEVVFVLPRSSKVSAHDFKIVFADVPEIKIAAIDSLLAGYITSEKYSALRSKIKSRLYGSGLFEEVERYAMLSADIARNEPHDVIHAHDWLSFGAGMVAKSVSEKPLITHVHATEYDRAVGNINTHVYEREREGMHAADSVVAVSGYTKSIIENQYGVDPRKISVVHNGIDLGNQDLSQSGASGGLSTLKKAGYKMVLYVGRITVQKGVDYLMEAAGIVVRADPKVLFVVVGAGDMEGQIMGQAASLGISDKVLFPGFLRGAELADAYNNADLFVMPSVSEPFGIVGLEALAHNVPLIVSKQSGISEVFSHVMKVDFWDVEEMADKMLSVIQNESLGKVLSQNGGQEVLGHTWDRAAQELVSLYKTL